MQLTRTFKTSKDADLALRLITAHLTGQGYKPVAGTPIATFQRGSPGGAMFAFSPGKAFVTVTIQTQPGGDQFTQMNIAFELGSRGQYLTKKETAYWEGQIAGVVHSVDGFDAQVPPITAMQVRYQAERRIANAANWFYWIAALSLINSILFITGQNLNFLIGLGITQLIDGFSSSLAAEMTRDAGMVVRLVAFTLNVLIAGVVGVFGLWSRKNKWGFIIGMATYALDGMIFLLVMDILSIGFHIFVLVMLFGGLRALLEYQKIPPTAQVQFGDAGKA